MSDQVFSVHFRSDVNVRSGLFRSEKSSHACHAFKHKNMELAQDVKYRIRKIIFRTVIIAMKFANAVARIRDEACNYSTICDQKECGFCENCVALIFASCSRTIR